MAQAVAEQPEQAVAPAAPEAPPAAGGRGDALVAGAVAAAIAATAFLAEGGSALGPLTTWGVAAIAAGGLLCAAAILRGRPASGGLVVALFAAFVALTGLSVLWAVSPSDAWIEANRVLALFAAFAGTVALAALAPDRWRGIVGGIALACTGLCAYALASKCFPAQLAADAIYPRLREPFGYWNAVGVTAALGIAPLLWLGSRRDCRPALRALATPALALCAIVLVLAYSRGGLLAGLAAAATWFWLAPQARLASAGVLLTALAAALPATAWALSQDALTGERVPLPAREQAGDELLLASLAMLAAAAVLGGLLQAWRSRRAPDAPARDRIRRGLLALAAAAALAGAAALTFSGDGLARNVESAWSDLTDTTAPVPNDAGRLTAASSTRARYWSEAWNVWLERPVLGAGAEGFTAARLRHRNDHREVRHAHGFAVQTLADLGLAGVALMLALLTAWIVSARRAMRAAAGRRREGLAALAAVAVCFGVHATVDWTWSIPATALTGLIAAGWLAGSGPARWPQGRLSLAQRRLAAGATAIIAVAAAWSSLGPLRAQHAGQDALAALAKGRLEEARSHAERSEQLNPLAVEPLFDLAAIEEAAGDAAAAQDALERAVRRQPASPEPWRRLADLQLALGNPQAAMASLGAALYLDPLSDAVRSLYVQAQRASATR